MTVGNSRHEKSRSKDTLDNVESLDRDDRPALFWIRGDLLGGKPGSWNYNNSSCPSILRENDAERVWKKLVDSACRLKTPVLTNALIVGNIGNLISIIVIAHFFGIDIGLTDTISYILLGVSAIMSGGAIHYASSQRNSFEIELQQVRNDHNKDFQEKGFELEYERHKIGWDKYAFAFQIKQAGKGTAKQAEIHMTEIHTYAIEGIEGGSGGHSGGYQSTSSTDNVRVSLPSLP